MKHDFKVGDFVKFPTKKSIGESFDVFITSNNRPVNFKFKIVSIFDNYVVIQDVSGNWDFAPEDLELLEEFNYEIF